nr:ankyrin repeat domain-containing protein [Achromobacter ruhlandii]
MKEQELENKVVSGGVEITLPRNMRLEDFERLYPSTIEFQHVVNINLRNPEGRLERLDELARVGGDTAVHDMLASAASFGWSDVVDHIVKNYSIPYQQSTNAMQLAAGLGHTQVIEVFIEHRIPISGTVLAVAASQGQLEVVEQLLEHGASPAAGINAAAMSGQIEVVETLLKAGASIDAAMERGSETTKDFCKAYRLREQLNQMSEKTQVSKKPTVRKI